MFDEPHDLTPDLEWMLQSGQVSDDVLAEALVRETYADVYRLALALLGDEMLARQAVMDTYTAALLNVYRYKSQIGVRPWLYRLAIGVCRSRQRRETIKRGLHWALRNLMPPPPDADDPKPSRQPEGIQPEADAQAAGEPAPDAASTPAEPDLQPPVPEASTPPPTPALGAQVFPAPGAAPDEVLLQAFERLPVATRLPYLLLLVLDGERSLPHVLGAKPEQVETRLASARQQFLEALGAEGLAQVPDFDLRPQMVDARLIDLLERHWPVPDISPAELEALAAEATANARRSGGQRRWVTHLREAGLVVGVVLAVALIFWAVNRFSPETAAEGTGTPQAGVVTTEESPAGGIGDLGIESTLSPGESGPDGFRRPAIYLARPGDTLPGIALQLEVPLSALQTLEPSLAPPPTLTATLSLTVTPSLTGTSSITVTPGQGGSPGATLTATLTTPAPGGPGLVPSPGGNATPGATTTSGQLLTPTLSTTPAPGMTASPSAIFTPTVTLAPTPGTGVPPASMSMAADLPGAAAQQATPYPDPGTAAPGALPNQPATPYPGPGAAPTQPAATPYPGPGFPGGGATPSAPPTTGVFVTPGATITTTAGAPLTTTLIAPSPTPAVPGALEPGQTVLVDLSKLPTPPVGLPPVTPMPQAAPLTMEADPAAVQDLIEHSYTRWHSLWVDLQMAEYGPANYTGPARAFRIQAWIDPREDSLELVGLPEGAPRWVTLHSSDYVLFTNQDTKQTILNPPWVAASDLPGSPALQKLLYPALADDWDPEGQVQVLEAVEFAGRPALVVDWWNVDGWRDRRLWVDAQTGVVLRRQEYNRSLPQTLISEMVVTAIAYDQDFPERWFDPLALRPSQFVADAQAADLAEVQAEIAWEPAPRLELLKDIPPAGFDPAQSVLAFQVPKPLPDRPASRSPVQPLELFGEGYFLGETQFGLPWSLICDRSPDGQLLAYAAQLDGISRADPELRWLNLSNPQAVYQPLPNFIPQAFAFSPDSRRLAVIGAAPYTHPGGLYVVHLGSGAVEQILPLREGRSIVWSPDGTAIALTGIQTTRTGEAASGELWQEELIIVEVGSRLVSYRYPLDGGDLSSIPEDAPLWYWGVSFPAPLSAAGEGMQACAAP